MNSKNNNVRQTIRDKREWHSPPLNEKDQAKGFSGWRSRGYLPHFDAPGVRQFLTYRLEDGLPASRRREWESLLELEDERERQIQIEAYLDKGFGECHLRNPQVADMVQNGFLFFDDQRYRLLAWVVMPNHVHVLIELGEISLAEIIHSWKSFTAKEANRMLNRTGAFWQVEYFDRYIRDEEHFRKAVHYIEWNPVKAHLVNSPEEGRWSSASQRPNRSAGVPPASLEINRNPQKDSPT
ncbi:MAG: transposase [Verrucomicrobiota bacterium]